MLRKLKKTVVVFVIVTVLFVLQQELTPAVAAASIDSLESRQVELMRDPEEADIFSTPGLVVVLRDPEEADIF